MAKQKKVLFSWALCALATICFIAAAGVSQRGVRAADDVFYFAESAEDIDITSTLGTLTSINGYVGPAFLTKSPSLVDDGDAASGKAVKIIFHNWAATGTYRPLLFSEAKSIDELNSLSIRIKAHLSSASTYQTAFGGVRLFASDSDGTGGYMLPADIVQDEWIVLTLNKEQLALLADADGNISGLQVGSMANFGNNAMFYSADGANAVAHILIDTVYAELDLYYNVTFDSAGGTAVSVQKVEKAGAKASRPEDPEKAGYIFTGWTLGGVAFDFNTVITGNITLVAQWESLGINLTTAIGDFEFVNPVLTHINGRNTIAPDTAYGKSTISVVDAEGAVDGAAFKMNFHSWGIVFSEHGVKFAESVEAEQIEGLIIRVYAHFSTSSTYNTSLGGVRLYGLTADGNSGPGYLIPADVVQNQWTELVLTKSDAQQLADTDGKISGFQIASAQQTGNSDSFNIGTPGQAGSAYLMIDTVAIVKQVEVTFDYGGIESESRTIYASTRINNPYLPTRTGKIFAGWFLGNKLFDFSKLVYTDTVLTAKWFDAADSHQSAGLYYNSTATGRYGADGAHIYIGPDGAIDLDDLGLGDTIVTGLGAGGTVIAVTTNFNAYEFTIGEDGDFVPVQAVKATLKTGAGDIVTHIKQGTKLNEIDWSRPGMIFLRWVDTDGEEFDFSAALTADIVLWAQWDYNEIDEVLKPFYYAEYYSKEADSFLKLSEDGKAELTSQSGTTVYDFYILVSGTLVLENDNADPILCVLTAQRIILDGKAFVRLASYTVTFDSCGGTPVEQIKVGASYKITAPANPQKRGYTFTGWHLVDGQAFDFDSVITESITLYAGWEYTSGTGGSDLSGDTDSGRTLSSPYVVAALVTAVLVVAGLMYTVIKRRTIKRNEND